MKKIGRFTLLEYLFLPLKPERKEIEGGDCELSLSLIYLNFKEPRNRFLGLNSASICSPAGRYDNPIPTQFIALIECLKIPAVQFAEGEREW